MSAIRSHMIAVVVVCELRNEIKIKKKNYSIAKFDFVTPLSVIAF